MTDHGEPATLRERMEAALESERAESGTWHFVGLLEAVTPTGGARS